MPILKIEHKIDTNITPNTTYDQIIINLCMVTGFIYGFGNIDQLFEYPLSTIFWNSLNGILYGILARIVSCFVPRYLRLIVPSILLIVSFININQ